MASTAKQPLAGPDRRLVVGCGYLGERVARRWAAAGSQVVATTRRDARADALKMLGLEPAVVDVTASDPGWERLLDRGGVPAAVFWGVGFDRTAGTTHHDVHVHGLRRLLDALAAARGSAPPPRVILSRSPGVWGDAGGDIVTEATPPCPAREAGRVLLEAESVLATHPAGPGTALRFAGLYGPGRLPRIADLEAGRPIAADPDSWLNLIHVDDAAAVVSAVGVAPSVGGLSVVSDGRPIRRREWYGRIAALTGSPEPRWDPTAARERGADKRVDPARLVADLGFRPVHPDALAAVAVLLDRPV
ncbi:MAG: NAD-dependent epimerase/dehydratase family protein [Planctomycetota bacterium]